VAILLQNAGGGFTMQTGTSQLTQATCHTLLLVVVVIFTLNSAFQSKAIAVSPTEELLHESNISITIAQGLCLRRITEHASVDRAIAHVNELKFRGINAWFEYHGTINNRTYVVFAMLPC
jgi:hypothetical protein